MMKGRGFVRRGLFVVGVLLTAGVCVQATVLDFNTAGDYGTINDAFFMQYSLDVAGTGVIDSFLRIQGTGAQYGYNTDGAYEFETKSGSHSLLLSDIPTTAAVNGGGITYREFFLDINQNGQEILSIDEIEIYLETTGNLSGYPGAFSSPIFDLDAGEDSWIMLDDRLGNGSGRGDMLVYIPDSVFTSAANYNPLGNNYIYLYNGNGENSVADDGFEEWYVGMAGPIIPEPATFLLIGLGAALLRRKR